MHRAGSVPLTQRLSAYLWWAEQKLATLIAITLGTLVGLVYGSYRATLSLAPHFKSAKGIKSLYYGDPAATLSSQSRAYVKDSFASAKLKPSGEALCAGSCVREAG